MLSVFGVLTWCLSGVLRLDQGGPGWWVAQAGQRPQDTTSASLSTEPASDEDVGHSAAPTKAVDVGDGAARAADDVVVAAEARFVTCHRPSGKGAADQAEVARAEDVLHRLM